MHVSELAELAALAAVQTPHYLAGGNSFPARQLERYWTASKCRLDGWLRSLRELRQQSPMGPPADGEGPLKPLVEEILAGEVLTRIWAAAVAAHDRGRTDPDGEPLARSIYFGHLEVRNRVLHQLLSGQGLTTRQQESLNLLRRRMERWTDALLAHLAPAVDVTPWCFDCERTNDFIQDLRDNPSPPAIILPYVTASIRGAVRAGTRSPSPHPHLNRQIAASIVSCFPTGQIDPAHLPLPLWLERLETSAADAQGLLDELYVLEGLDNARG